MPNLRAGEPMSLDEIRKEPGRLYGVSVFRRLGIISSYDGVQKLVKAGKLAEPHRIGDRMLWEGREILKLFGEGG